MCHSTTWPKGSEAAGTEIGSYKRLHFVDRRRERHLGMMYYLRRLPRKQDIPPPQDGKTYQANFRTTKISPRSSRLATNKKRTMADSRRGKLRHPIKEPTRPLVEAFATGELK
jgi:hypothetical protein